MVKRLILYSLTKIITMNKKPFLSKGVTFLVLLFMFVSCQKDVSNEIDSVTKKVDKTVSTPYFKFYKPAKQKVSIGFADADGNLFNKILNNGGTILGDYAGCSDRAYLIYIMI